MDKENLILSAFKNEFNGDDGAVVGKYCFSKDLFVEGVHFKKEWLNYAQIARKALLVNLSDAITMNAVPKYALLGLALPKDISKAEIKALQKGFLDTAREFGVQIIGGDTISSDKIIISVTIIAKVRKKAVFRKGLKKGDLLAFTGDLGQSMRDLNTLLKGGRVVAHSKFIAPKLKGAFFYKIASKISCAMDISDGLSKDLSRLLKLNKLGVKFLKNLSQNELMSGEEYEILFGFSPKNEKEIQKIASKMGVKITIFGEAIKGEYKFKGKEHHFE